MLEATQGSEVPQMKHNVVVPLDGSPLAEAALEVAQALFAPSVADLLLVTVLPSEGTERQEQHARAYLDMIAWELEERGYRTKTYVLFGDPATTLEQFARASGATVLVLTTHGQGENRALPLGRTAYRLVQQAAVPVMTVPVRDRIHAANVVEVPTTKAA